MVLGSARAPLSQRPLLNPSPNERDKIQSTPQDRIPTSKTSSHQPHSQMVRAKQMAEMPLAEHDNVVKTLPPDRTNRPFTISVLPRRSRRGWPVPNTHRPKAADEDVAVDRVAVTNDVSRRYFPTIGLG